MATNDIKSLSVGGAIRFSGSSSFSNTAELKANNIYSSGGTISILNCTNVTVAENIYAYSYLDIFESNLTANSITVNYSNATFRNSTITVGKTGNKTTALNAKTVTALNTKLTVNGDAKTASFYLARNVLNDKNDVTINGSLKTTNNSTFDNLSVLFNSKLTVTGDVKTGYFITNEASQTEINGNLDANGYMNLIGNILGQTTSLKVDGNLTSSGSIISNGESYMEVKGNVKTPNDLQIINDCSIYDSATSSYKRGKTEAHIGGSVTAAQFNTNFDSKVTIGKDATLASYFDVIGDYYSDKAPFVTVGGNVKASQFHANYNTELHINGDAAIDGCFEVIGDSSSDKAPYVTVGGDVKATQCHANYNTELHINGDAAFVGYFDIIGEGADRAPYVTVGGDASAYSSHINQGSDVSIGGDYTTDGEICIIGISGGKEENTKVNIGGDVESGYNTHINNGAGVTVSGNLTANKGLNVCSNNTKLHVGGNVESTTTSGVFEGTTIIDGNLTDSATYLGKLNNTSSPYGIGVSGSLTVGGDVNTGDLLFDSYSSATHDNITVGGTITGRRVANIEVPEYYTTYYDGSSSYSLTNSGYDESDNAIAPFYIRAFIPYDTDEVDFTDKDGKAYMAIINDNQGAYQAIDYHEHKYGEYTADNNATCLKNGTEIAVCTIDGCDAKDTREIANTMLEHSYTTFVETKDPTCIEDGYTVYACANGCDKTETTVIPATGHNIETVGEIAATSTTEGYTGDKVCKTCGETVEKGEAIPATGISSVINVPAAAEVNCYQTVSYTVTASDIPEGYELVLYVNGRKVASAEADAEGNAAITTEIAKVTETKNITATIEKDGLVARNDSGDIKAESEITVANGFLAKIVALIKYIIGNIFGSNKAVELVP